jgi:hypothetical protein
MPPLAALLWRISRGRRIYTEKILARITKARKNIELAADSPCGISLREPAEGGIPQGRRRRTRREVWGMGWSVANKNTARLVGLLFGTLVKIV